MILSNWKCTRDRKACKPLLRSLSLWNVLSQVGIKFKEFRNLTSVASSNKLRLRSQRRRVKPLTTLLKPPERDQRARLEFLGTPAANDKEFGKAFVASLWRACIIGSHLNWRWQKLPSTHHHVLYSETGVIVFQKVVLCVDYFQYLRYRSDSLRLRIDHVQVHIAPEKEILRANKFFRVYS